MKDNLICPECGSESITPIPTLDDDKIGQCESCGELAAFTSFVATDTGEKTTQLTVEKMWAAATGEEMDPDLSKMDKRARLIELKALLNQMNVNQLLRIGEGEIEEALLYHLRSKIRTAWVGHNQHLAFPNWDLEAE